MVMQFNMQKIPTLPKIKYNFLGKIIKISNLDFRKKGLNTGKNACKMN